MTDISHNIKKIRQQCGCTQEELAKKLGVSQTAIALWENGTRTPSMDIIEKIANIFDIRPSFLMGWDDCNIKIDQNIDEEIKKLSATNLTQEEVIALVKKIDTLIYAQNQLEDNIEKINTTKNTDINAIHFDNTEYTEKELEEIKQFAEFLIWKRIN